MDSVRPIVLDLCGGTGSWSRPYREAGYDVRIVTLPEQDVRTFVPPLRVYGVIAAPPCTEFASSGARWWKAKPPHLLDDALAIVRACLRIVAQTNPVWWALENPVGRLRRFIGPARWTWEPWEFGNCWTKKTLMWGRHVIPAKRPCCRPSPRESWVWRLPPGVADRAMLRSLTPPGFAQAFFEANP